jgi:hypothetical protein
MTTKIHYSDNIFYLETLLKTIKTGVSLEIDSDYFKTKIMEDILFTGAAFSRTYAALKLNAHLINKNEYLRSFLRAKRNFVNLLEDILAKRLPFAAHLESGFPQFTVFRAEQIRDIAEIKAQIEKDHREDSSSKRDVISGEEFRFLFKSDELPEAPN